MTSYDPSLYRRYDIDDEVQTLEESPKDPNLPNYVRRHKIGKGSYGLVWLVDKVNPSLPPGHPNRTVPVAMKSISRKPIKDERWKQLRPKPRQNLPTTGHTGFVDKLSETEVKIRREIAIMKKCRHPHVVRLLEVINDPTQDKIHLGKVWRYFTAEYTGLTFFIIVMEYQAGGEVKWQNPNHTPCLTVVQTRRILRDVILGVEYRQCFSLRATTANIHISTLPGHHPPRYQASQSSLVLQPAGR